MCMKAWSLSATISSIGLFTFSEPSILGLKFFVPGALVCMICSRPLVRRFQFLLDGHQDPLQ